jgi:hypothetical protein
MPEPRILLSGLGIPESPRWRGGRLWFCNWIDRQVVAADMDGTAEVMLTRDLAARRQAADDRRQAAAPGARRIDGRPRRAARK